MKRLYFIGQLVEELLMPFATVSGIVLVLLAMLYGAHAQTGTAQTKPALNTEQGTNFPDNSSGLITPALLRQTVVDFIASWEQAGKVRAVTAVSDTLLNTDTGWLVTYSNGSPVAVALPQATGNFLVWDATICNKGAGLVTITPATSTINGGATLTLATSACQRIYSDGANYQATTAGCSNELTQDGNGGCRFSTARRTLPTVSVVTAGAHSGGFGANSSGTYTTPANVLWIEITMVGGGAGGGASGGAGGNGSPGGNTCWNTSGAACSTPVYQAGGGAGGIGGATGTAGGGAGTIAGSSPCTWQMNGSPGFGAPATSGGGANNPGGAGGSSTRGGGGANNTNTAGQAGQADSGSGGQAGGNGATSTMAGGGGSGATCYVIIGTPAATYTYAVGASGGGGTGGTMNGGAGASGIITVVEHYGS